MASPIYERLSKLSFTRPSGTAEEKRAAEFLAGEIRAIGFEPTLEPFSYTRSVPTQAYFAAILENGEEVSFPVTGVINSKETPPQGITADFFYLKSLDEVSLSQIRGKMVLIHDRLSPQEYARLQKAGITGYITTSGTVRDTYENSDLETQRFRDSLHDLGAVPAFAIRMIDAVRLLRISPEKVRFTLTLKEETVHSQNVSVTVLGTEFPNEILAVGAHYDSVPFSYGAWDNGAGAVQVLSLLEHFKAHPPRRTVKVVLFGSEETGLQGSRAYVIAHEKEAEKTLAMVNVDVGGSILGKEILFVTANDDTEIWLRQVIKEVGYAAVTTQRVMSSDSAVFSDHGIPSISIGQGAPRGGGYMHTRYDNMELISQDVLEKEAWFLSQLVNRLTNAAVFPVPRILPAKLRQELIQYFGESQSAMAKRPVAEEERPLPFHF